jgi:hypothetical protein
VHISHKDLGTLVEEHLPGVRRHMAGSSSSSSTASDQGGDKVVASVLAVVTPLSTLHWVL